jgi:single-stranded-DNA-specific exonuclease
VSPKKEWVVRATDSRVLTALQDTLDWPGPLAAALANRGITDPETVRHHLSPGLSELHSPSGLPDIDVVVERIERAINTNDRIRVYADHDVDGSSGGALLVKLLAEFGATVDYDGPGKWDGFGLNTEAIEDLVHADTDLLLTVDCGTTAHDLLAEATAAGVDVIVTDHHNPETYLPNVLACVNPRREDSQYPNPNLAGGAVAYKVGEALVAAHRSAEREDYRRYALPLAAIATMGDYMALNLENRALVRAGYERLADCGLPGLLEVATNRDVESMRDLSWSLTSFLNAAQEDEAGGLLIELLLAEDPDRIDAILETLEDYQEQRRQDRTDRQAHLEACFEAQVDPEASDLYLVETDRYVGGVSMSRLSEEWGRPVIAYRRTNGHYRGGGRSEPDVNFLELFAACGDLLEEYWGHPGAAGFQVAAESLEQLKARLQEALAERYDPADLRPTLEIDARLALPDIDRTFLDRLEQLQPFGPSHEEPTFLFEGLEVEDYDRFGEDDRHVKLRPADADDVSVIHWDGAAAIAEIDHPATYDIVGTVGYDDFAELPSVTVADFRVPSVSE